MKKQGISLIVLVITIIVLAILAAAVIISINNTGIINSSQQTVLTDAYGTLTDLLTMKYTDLKVAANMKTFDDEKQEWVEPEGVVLEEKAVTAYTEAFTSAGFTAVSGSTIAKGTAATFEKTNGSHTMTVTFTLGYDGTYTVSNVIATATK